MLCESWEGLVVVGLWQERKDSDSAATENSARYVCPPKILKYNSITNHLQLAQTPQVKGIIPSKIVLTIDANCKLGESPAHLYF